eukprot:3451889-Alexandrium_andersonii.AAC.1
MSGEREWSRAARGSGGRPPWTRPIPPEAARAATLRVPRTPPRSTSKAAGPKRLPHADAPSRPRKMARRDERAEEEPELEEEQEAEEEP